MIPGARRRNSGRLLPAKNRSTPELSAGRIPRAVTANLSIDADADAGASAARPPFRRALLVIGIYGAAAAALLPIATWPGPAIPGINPAFATGIFVTQVTTAFLLFVRFRERRDLAFAVLACAYFYSALMAIPYVLTFPEAVLSNGAVFGGPQSTSWIFLSWVVGFAALALAAVLLAAGEERRVAAEQIDRLISFSIAAIVGLFILLTMNAVWLMDYLPPLIGGFAFTPLGTAPGYIAVVILVFAIAIIFLRVRRHISLFLWLAIALTAMACANLLSNFGGARYTIGWSVGRLSWLASGCVLFLYFIEEFVRQQRILGLARDTLEQHVAERTADLTKMVNQRDILLREVHHRVKNNFQVVNSLINFLGSHAHHTETRDALQNLHRRVYSLGLVHRQQMQSGNLATFDVREFLDELCASLTTWPDAGERRVRVTADADPLTADLDFAGPLGLLVTELVTKAVKRGFPGGQFGKVAVSLRRRGTEEAVLTVTDNAAEAKTAGADDPESRIMVALVKQLNGELADAYDAGGTTVTVTLRNPKLHAL